MVRGVAAERHRKLALKLVWLGVGWNMVEAGVALWAGVMAGSVALLAYGLDAFIELFAGFVLVWRLGREWKEKEEEEEKAEAKALRLVAITFFLLSAYILVQASATLLRWLPQPQESPVGIALVIASAVIMTVLYLWKTDLARKLSSRSLRAEAIQSLMCDLQDLTLVLGLGLNALWGWWWADPVAALALVPFLVKEGKEGLFGRE